MFVLVFVVVPFPICCIADHHAVSGVLRSLTCKGVGRNQGSVAFTEIIAVSNLHNQTQVVSVGAKGFSVVFVLRDTQL